MIAPAVDHILQFINQQPKAEAIKKLLFLKLEVELNETRCVIGEKDGEEIVLDGTTEPI